MDDGKVPKKQISAGMLLPKKNVYDWLEQYDHFVLFKRKLGTRKHGWRKGFSNADFRGHAFTKTINEWQEINSVDWLLRFGIKKMETS